MKGKFGIDIARLVLLSAIACLVLSGCRGRKTEKVRGWYQTPEAAELRAVEPPKPADLSQESSWVELTPEYFQPYDPSEYKVAIGDNLEVSIYGHQDSAGQTIPVAPDGKLYYYFLPGIPAVGRSLVEIAQEIENGVRHLYANPEVSIIPKSISAAHYTILGKVEYPGTYGLSSSVDLRAAIADAGGVAAGGVRGSSIPIASLKYSFIMRDGERLPVDFGKLYTDDGEKQNIKVRPGDYIYIASAIRQRVYRMGAVRQPRPVIYKDGMTLMGVLADPSGVLSGWTPRAFLKQVVIVRGSLDDPKVQIVNVEDILAGKAHDVYLMPEDIVYVPPKRFKWLQTLVKTAVGVFIKSFGGNAGDHYAEEHWFN